MASAPLGVVNEFERDPNGTGLLVSLTDPRDKVTTFGYDNNANLASITTPLGNHTAMTYDPAGRLLTLVDPRGNVSGANPAEYTSSFTYNATDHLLTLTDPLGNVTDSTYDDVGNLAGVTDASDHTTSYGYDAANNLTSVTDAADEVTSYAYDDTGNLTSRTDANDQITTYTFDDAGRLAATEDPLHYVWSLSYDAASNVATRTDANDNTTTFAYDAINRITGITYADPSTPAVTLSYDASSNLTTMIDGLGTETYAVDDLNRLTSVTRGTDTFAYGYDLSGNITSRTYPGESAQIWTYDDDGRLASANGVTYGYDPAGNVLTADTPDGLTAHHTWDRAGRLREIAHTTTTDTLSRFTYALDPVGNPTAMTTREATVTYRYDDLDRLTEACWSSATCPGGAPASPAACVACVGALLTRPAATVTPPAGETFHTYSYDSVGNRLTEASNAGTTTYAYDAADQLTSVTPPGQSAIAYTYDDNGNQTAAGSKTFTWDLADRLISATVGDATESYVWTGDGRRASATAGGSTTRFYWDHAFRLPQLALERNGTGGLLRSYRYGFDLVSQTTGALTAWYHHDGLGSVSDLIDATGTALAWSEYYPFGVVRVGGVSGTPATQPFQFAGEHYDEVTGLYHLRARQYDPTNARFISRDPVAALRTDPHVTTYAYVRNMPTSAVDPSGKCLQQLGLAVFGPPGAVAAGGSLLVCVGAVLLGAAAVTGTTAYVAQNPPNIDIDLAVPEFPEPFEPERHQDVLDAMYQSGDLGWEIRPQLSQYCKENSKVCAGGKVAAILATFAIVMSSLKGDGDITEPPNCIKRCGR